jgi:hypothetical protein
MYHITNASYAAGYSCHLKLVAVAAAVAAVAAVAGEYDAHV